MKLFIVLFAIMVLNCTLVVTQRNEERTQPSSQNSGSSDSGSWETLEDDDSNDDSVLPPLFDRNQDLLLQILTKLLEIQSKVPAAGRETIVTKLENGIGAAHVDPEKGAVIAGGVVNNKGLGTGVVADSVASGIGIAAVGGGSTVPTSAKGSNSEAQISPIPISSTPQPQQP